MPISAYFNDDFITLDELYDSCGVPGDCNQGMECEGKFVLVKGYINYVNVQDKRKYYWLPYGKFLIYNVERNINVEVWVDSDDAEKIFNRIEKHRDNPNDPVYIKGRMVGVDLPFVGGCHRDLLIYLSETEAIFFGSDIYNL